jgi:hypothetical protein
MTSPAAFYDTLVLADRIERRIGSVAGPEIHLFGYLACLLAVYHGWPATDWEYRFACTENGAPFSHEIQTSIEELLSLGYLMDKDEALGLDSAGREMESFLSSLEVQHKRLPFLEGATSSLLGMSAGMVRRAISAEPSMQRATALARKQLLLDDVGQTLVYDEFEAISAAIGGDVSDLMVPAMVWLTTLMTSATSTEGT